MKTKLTVTIDRDVVPRAKRYARMRGVSLSQLIELALRELGEEPTSSFSDRWKGAFAPAQRSDDLYKALARKHL
jgi:hypothetical protein